MVSEPHRADVWWAEMPDKRRPVVILTRDAAIPVLRMLMVAPVTTRVRGIPTEVPLDASDGMPSQCVATLDNVTLADRSFLVERLAKLSPIRMDEICRALNIAVGC